MLVICIVHKSAIFHGKEAKHAGVLGLSASKDGAFNTLVSILNQIWRPYKDRTCLKGSSQIDRRTLLTDCQSVVVIKVLTLANSLR